MKQPTLAAIDLGTNSCRLLIADRSGRTLYKNAISTRLGEGMSAGNRFTDEAVMRGIECFCTFKMTMDEYGTEKYRAIATAACRTAENGAEFAKKIKQQSGIDLEIIDGYEEAVLNLKGALLNVRDEKAGYVVVYDLGDRNHAGDQKRRTGDSAYRFRSLGSAQRGGKIRLERI